ncbi:Catechol 2,3-dioxygenase [Thalassobacillus cyri]|uniref:Catechol 2,3-dioxygenase n=1 Tax=Thalassobacillus cyri TaxID=571932 RepID=A0A1H3XL83_9BACI|nr:VOC family protein [Thalassobacillus cyri]SEA00106.1 Catechol 2,3-dioxygenase [Thalassobacillus cyri]
MRIYITSVFVKDQAKALQFYTEVLGFEKKMDLPAGDFRWLTVVSPEGSGAIDLLLEPNLHPAAKQYQESIYREGIPAASFAVDDIYNEYERLEGLGVKFTTRPTKMGGSMVAVFDDTCGNVIQLVQG